MMESNNIEDINLIIENDYVHKMNYHDLIFHMLNLNKDDKIRLLKIMINEMDLVTAKEYADRIGKSYNGVKNFGETINISGKYFVSNLK